jgi:hypothetical protein
MPTVIGLIFVGLGVLCLVKKEEWLFGLVVISGLFEAASAINFGSQGIQPYYILACLFIYSQGKKASFWNGTSRFKGENYLFAFGCVGVLSALVCPLIFAGIPVYSPKVGLDDGFLFRPPLSFSLSNVAQAVYLIINLLTVKSAVSLRRTDSARIAYNFSFWLLAVLIFVQFACLQVGIAFPYSALQNNPGYSPTEISGLDASARVMGTFTEPSGAGLALVLFFAGYFYEFFAKGASGIKVVIAAISIGLVRSSSSLVAMAVAVTGIILFFPIFRSPLVIRKPRLVKLISVLAAVVIVLASPAGAALRTYTADKGEGLSYIHRTAADLFSLELAADTHWIGVGLGSNRPSSLLTSLLSNVGIVGTILFFCLVIQVARNAQKGDIWIRWSLFGAIFAQSLGVPDITQQMLWIVLALAAHYGQRTQAENSRPHQLAAASSSAHVS